MSNEPNDTTPFITSSFVQGRREMSSAFFLVFIIWSTSMAVLGLGVWKTTGTTQRRLVYTLLIGIIIGLTLQLLDSKFKSILTTVKSSVFAFLNQKREDEEQFLKTLLSEKRKV
tara:strand:+ start:891 stop:1232 length:342 start_codon:yes stop_codon:yes gene_type:complete